MRRTEKEKRKRARNLAAALIFILVPLVPPGTPAEASDERVVEASGRAILLNQGPYEEATDDWNVMVERLESAIRRGKGENVNYSAGNSFTVPTEILEKLKGRNATLALHTSNGVTFSVSGRDVSETGWPVSVQVGYEPVVSEASLEQVQGYPVVKHFYMREKEPYPCRVNVHMALGEENYGNLAILYYYDENGDCLRQEDTFRITADGHAIFGLDRGDEYVVTVMKGYRVASGDTLSRIAVRHGLTLSALKEANPQIQNPDLIRVGQMVNIPNP